MKHPVRLFFKNFITHLLTISIPVIILGALAFNLTYYYIYDNATKSSFRSLEQVKQYVGQLAVTSDTIGNTFNPDAFSSMSLKQILKKEKHSYQASISLSVFSSILNSLVNSSQCVESAYVYWPNQYKKLLSSNRGITYLNVMKDTGWLSHYQAFSEDLTRSLDVQTRLFSDGSGKSHPVITFYQKILTLDYKYAKGIVIVNLKPELIREYLQSQQLFLNQQIYLLNKDGSFLVGTNTLTPQHESILMTLLESPEMILHKGQDHLTISVMKDETLPFIYVSMIPDNQLYAIPQKLFLITLLLVCFSLLLSLTLAAVYSKRTSRNIQLIMDIFDAAQNEKQLPQKLSVPSDEYGYIITNLISTFINQEYLAIQLSEKMYRSKVLELIALQSQINPHFLFNTLETIHFRAFHLTNGANDVTYLIENLSGIMRYTLSNPNEYISFRDEIEYTKSYLNIQKFRYKNKFHVIWEYDDTVLFIPVIKLLMQPLIENSIYHGIKETSKECVLKIKAYEKHGMFYLHIIDSGIGMTPETLKNLRLNLLQEEKEHFEHIGLFNTYKRLKLTYGNLFRINIKSKFQRGTAVTLVFPVQDSP